MIRGLWISAGAMTPAVHAQEIYANNLANAGTAGFREDRVAFHRLEEAAAGPPGRATRPNLTGAQETVHASTENMPGAPHLLSRMDMSAGPMETTERRYDLSLSGPGFFVVQGPEGEMYTRDGSLERGTDGTLLHRSGFPLLTESGTIVVPPSGDFAVAADGTAFVNGSPVGKLRLAALPDSAGLRHTGLGLLAADTPAETDTTSRVIQGSREGANIDAVRTMVDMMVLLRGFEANQKAILAQDGTLGKLIQWAAG